MIRVINSINSEKYLENLKKRSIVNYNEVFDIVEKIISEVKKNKNEALRNYTLKFDKVKLDHLEVSKEEIETALKNIDSELFNTLKKAKENIEKFHKLQVKNSFTYKPNGEDIILGQLIKPIERVGIYVPGGKAAYSSTVLMNAVPAKIAGVEEIIMITPPDKDGGIKDSILAAAHIAGVDKIYKVGGAQGIAALTYGTETIPKVSKITGPGNIYVTAAKRKVSGIVGIDMIAGPSEILIIADDKANPKYIAADMISQAEHDELAASILVTDSPALANKVIKELKRQTSLLERSNIIKESLENFGSAIITNSLNESINIANKIAPEHLELLIDNPFKFYKQIRNAGAIFLGEYSPEPVGDYFAGPNHTLPTNSTSRFSSALCVDDFITKTSVIHYSKTALKESKDSIIMLADDEGLTAHSNSIKIRFEDE